MNTIMATVYPVCTWVLHRTAREPSCLNAGDKQPLHSFLSWSNRVLNQPVKGRRAARLVYLFLLSLLNTAFTTGAL